MINDDLSADVSWACAQLSDSLRLVGREGIQGRYCPISAANFSANVNYITLPNLHSDVQSLSYFSELSSLKDTMQYLLSKTLNQRCQSRKIGDVSLKCFEASTIIAAQLKRIILCSLLGNYETSMASSRPRAEVRLILYEIMLDQHAQFNGWFKHLLIDGSIIVLYCLREYLIFAIEDNPGLCESLSELMQLTQLSTITASAMNIIRAYVDAHMFEPDSAMNATVYKGDAKQPTPFAWCHELNDQLANCQKAVLHISYRRPKRHLLQCFGTVQKKLELVVNPWLVSQRVPVVDMDDEIASHSSLAGGFSKDADVDSSVDVTVDSFIPEHQLSAMTDIINRIMPMCRSDVLREFIPWLRHFGISDNVVEYAMTLNTSTSDDDVLSDENLRDRLSHLRKHQPHAYNLIQVATRVIQDKQRLRVLCNLPFHYWKNQITAIQSRFSAGDDADDGILGSMMYFVYCSICGTVYSLLRDFHSVYKQSYTYGYRDAVVDYDTDDIYCKNKKTTHCGQCAVRPLTHVMLLGRSIQYQNKTILLCPQLGCGMPMVLNTTYCAYNERGIACCDCTRAIYANAITNRTTDLMRRFVGESDQVACELCSRVLTQPAQMWRFPCNVIICRSHTTNHTVQRFSELAPADTSMMTERDVKLILDQVISSNGNATSVMPRGQMYKKNNAKRK